VIGLLSTPSHGPPWERTPTGRGSCVTNPRAVYLQWCLLAVALTLAIARPTIAGIYRIYDPREGVEFPQLTAQGAKALPFKLFLDVTSRFERILNDQLPNNEPRKQYLDAAQALRAKVRAGTITTDERVALSEYLIRLRQFEEAVELLTPTAAQERRNFMVFANLASAHQLAGRLDRALSYLQQAKDVWPAEWPGFDKDQLRWFSLAEKYHLKLVRLRYREAIRQGNTRKPSEGLDNLFGDDGNPVRFVGESGNYEPGKIAAKDRAKLPPEAIAVVQQLLIWFPEDTRLIWLLGELYNADGDVNSAYFLVDKCVWGRRYSDSELTRHRQLLYDEKSRLAQVAAESSGDTATSQPGWLPDRRKLIIVGGAAALVVAGLVYLQIRELRRRRK
jgi:tetratricopeptide (TPR) repeat protein